MDVREKLAVLADAAKYDASCTRRGSNTTRAGSQIGSTEGMDICHSYTPDGRCISLLKIPLPSFLIYDWQYCVNRISSDTRRARFSVGEVVSLTMEFYKRIYIERLFLSSGIIQNSDYTMEQIIAVAKSLREEHRYGGYIHLKTVPNASQALIEKAGRWADRLSVNIELPTESDLHQLAPEKKKPQIVDTMSGIGDKIDETKQEIKAGFKPPLSAPAGQSIQMIVGATATRDVEIPNTASDLYIRQGLRRVYYSAYSPIPHADARLPGLASPLIHEHRLYQTDWLIRFYGFDASEIVAQADRNLSLDVDPKLASALANRHYFPVDVNRASRGELLRIPGIGPGIGVRNVKRILEIRAFKSLRMGELKKLRMAWNRTKSFVVTADYNPNLVDLDTLALEAKSKTKDVQLMLFDTAQSAVTGEV